MYFVFLFFDFFSIYIGNHSTISTLIRFVIWIMPNGKHKQFFSNNLTPLATPFLGMGD